MSADVYRIDTSDTYGNSHAINRHETWEIVFHKKFPSHEEAVEFVTSMNMKNPDIVRQYYKMGAEELLKFRAEFMQIRGNLRYIKWFVGKPPMKEIREELIAAGILLEN